VDCAYAAIDSRITGLAISTNYQAATGGIAGNLVVWSDNRDFATTGQDIYGAVVDWSHPTPSAVEFPISKDADYAAYPDITFDAQAGKYLVTWACQTLDQSTCYIKAAWVTCH